MNPAATLHRYVHLLRRLQEPYSYPSKEKIIAELQDKGFPTSSRTFERDIQALKQEYGILITYHRQKKGYFWELPEDEDISHFNTFVRLLEHKERLDILSNSAGNWFKTARYLLLEHNDRFKGMDHLSQLWDALQTQRVINFLYQSYDKTAHKQRNVEPNLIVEDRNRWYLVGWDRQAKGIRSFGLDRMSELQFTGENFSRDIRKDFREQKEQIIGMTIHQKKPVEQVILRFTAKEAPYVKASPLHSTQKVLHETKTYVDFSLEVKLNYELEREILGYGEEVEVLEPEYLRKNIATRLQEMIKKYANRGKI